MFVARWAASLAVLLAACVLVGQSGAPPAATGGARTTLDMAVDVVPPPEPATTTTLAPVPVTVRQRASRAARPPRVRPELTPEIRARVEAAIMSYPWDGRLMVRVAGCESGLSPWAVNGRHHGIFQIAGSTLGLIEEHVALAFSMWQRRGMGPWLPSRHCWG